MKKTILFLTLIFLVAACTGKTSDVGMDMDEHMGEMEDHMSDMEAHMKGMHTDTDSGFEQMCKEAGYEWMLMKPTKDGKIIQGEKSCWGCMVEDIEHVCGMQQFMEMTGMAPTLELETKNLKEGSQALLKFKMTNPDGTQSEPVISHERLLHAIIIRDDFSSFSHVHPQYKGAGTFALDYEFTRGGRYVLGTDYATKEGLFSKKFIINVEGDSARDLEEDFSMQKNFAGYGVKLTPENLKEGEESALEYYIEKNKSPVKNLEPYLAAAMHVAIVKQDLSEFMHVHGEAHEASDSMDGMDDMEQMDEMMGHSGGEHEVPSSFGPLIEAHARFPSRGIYHLFGEFQHEGNVIVTSFMVEVK